MVSPMVRFIHTADWHLGMQAHFLPDEARARYAQDRFDAVARIAELADRERCAFVVVAGDVFDSNHVDRKTVAKAIEALRIFTVPVYLLAGNHDPLDPSSVFRTAAWCDRGSDRVIVIEEPAVLEVPGVAGVEVVGCPWRSKHALGDPLADAYGLAPPAAGVTRVVVGHGIVDELTPDSDDPSLISAAALRTAIADGRLSYAALGDRHSATEIDATEGRARYSGTPVSTNYGEIDPNHVLVITADAQQCMVQPQKIGSWQFQRTTRDLAGDEDVDALSAWLQALPAKPTTVLKLALRGTLSLAANARLEAVLEHNGHTFASLNTWDRHTELAVEPDQQDLAGLDVSGYVREALDQLEHETQGDDDGAAVAKDALNLLYRLAQR
jgi:DNA repair exonuclease SbcCD nuclease subunit